MSERDTILIRRSDESDAGRLRRLARLDDKVPHAGRALVAEVDGELRAALPLDGGPGFADPFAESGHALDLLRAHAAALAAVAA